MSYAVKEIFYTLAGRRGAGGARGGLLPLCRLQSLVGPRERPGGGDLPVLRHGVCGRGWAGRRKVRFRRRFGSGRGTRVGRKFQQNGAGLGKRFVVCTGGEPLLQLDAKLIAALHAHGFEIAVETNGTIAAPEGVDWLCVSPKAGAELVQRSGNELKLVYPQAGADPADFELLPFRHFFLQPMDGPDRDGQHRARAALLPRSSAVAIEPANPQDSRHPIGESTTRKPRQSEENASIYSDSASPMAVRIVFTVGRVAPTGCLHCLSASERGDFR